LELYNKINDIIFNQNDSNKIFYEEIKNVQNIRFDFDNDFLDILNSENDFIEQNKLICKLLNKNIEIKRHKLINKKMFNNIILKAEKSIKGQVKTICEIKKEKFLIINIIDKNNREKISFFKKSITENEYHLKISTDEDGNILDVMELKDGNLLIVKDKQFKIIELCIPELLIKNVQIKILENEYFKEIKEMSNGYLISSSFNNNEINQNKIIIWKKDLINGNYEIFKIYQGFQKALSILEINNYKFVSYFEDNTLFSYNLKLKKISNILLTIKIKKIFKKMIQVGKNGILLIFNQSLILFNLENSQYSLLKIYYDINSICSIDNSKKYFLASYSKDKDFGLFLLDINLNENRIYKIKKIFIKNAHSKVINCIYRLSDEIFITGSSDNTYKIWELK
jgi:WD40 repeat protein